MGTAHGSVSVLRVLHGSPTSGYCPRLRQVLAWKPSRWAYRDTLHTSTWNWLRPGPFEEQRTGSFKTTPCNRTRCKEINRQSPFLPCDFTGSRLSATISCGRELRGLSLYMEQGTAPGAHQGGKRAKRPPLPSPLGPWRTRGILKIQEDCGQALEENVNQWTRPYQGIPPGAFARQHLHPQGSKGVREHVREDIEPRVCGRRSVQQRKQKATSRKEPLKVSTNTSNQLPYMTSSDVEDWHESRASRTTEGVDF